MRDFVSDFNSMESNSETDSIKRNSDSNSNSNYGNSNSIPIQILAIPIQFQFRSDWEKPIQFQFQFRNWNWNWQAIPIPDRNWPQLWCEHIKKHASQALDRGGFPLQLQSTNTGQSWSVVLQPYPVNRVTEKT